MASTFKPHAAGLSDCKVLKDSMSFNKQQTINQILKEPDAYAFQNTFVFNPYNNQNREFTRQDLQTLFNAYGLSDVSIHNFELYQHAFVHSSYRVRPQIDVWKQSEKIYCKPRPPDCRELLPYDNERMEFLGDGILESVVKFYLYRRFPLAEPEFMNTTKISMVKNTSIGKLVLEMGLNQWFILSRQSEKDGMRTDLRVLGCLFEAFIGAIFLDFNHESRTDVAAGYGFQMAQRFIEAVFDAHGAWLSSLADTNHKNRVQIFVQKEFKVVPEYKLMEDYDRGTGYHVGLYICVQCPDEVPFRKLQKQTLSQFTTMTDIHFWIRRVGYICVLVGTAINRAKPDAEQEAALDAYEKLTKMPR